LLGFHVGSTSVGECAAVNVLRHQVRSIPGRPEIQGGKGGWQASHHVSGGCMRTNLFRVVGHKRTCPKTGSLK
jgi:hypothetical protein